MFFQFSKYFFIMLFFILICFLGLVMSFGSISNISETTNIIENSNFIWPAPSYTSITSYFGYRKAPTSGAGTYHAGIDIGAPAGAQVVASFSGTVTYVGFYGANGYTVRISDGTNMANYSHLSPYFLVYVGQYINKGDVIATVGPKNVYGVPNNKYKDSNGNPTNGATTGPHLHFSLYIDGTAINPLDYIQIK